MKKIKVKSSFQIIRVQSEIARRNIYVSLYRVGHPDEVADPWSYCVVNDTIYLHDSTKTRGMRIHYTELKERILKK